MYWMSTICLVKGNIEKKNQDEAHQDFQRNHTLCIPNGLV